jgi:hypothetical protein
VGQSLSWPYADKIAHAHAAARLLNAAERSQFLHGTAARIYGRRATPA